MSVRPIGPVWQPQPQQNGSLREAAAAGDGVVRGGPAAPAPAPTPVILAPLHGTRAAAPFLAQMIDQEMLGGGGGKGASTTSHAPVAIDRGSRAHATYSAAGSARPPAGLAADIEA
jgi:hypothetical protein